MKLQKLNIHHIRQRFPRRSHVRFVTVHAPSKMFLCPDFPTPTWTTSVAAPASATYLQPGPHSSPYYPALSRKNPYESPGMAYSYRPRRPISSMCGSQIPATPLKTRPVSPSSLYLKHSYQRPLGLKTFVNLCIRFSRAHVSRIQSKSHETVSGCQFPLLGPSSLAFHLTIRRILAKIFSPGAFIRSLHVKQLMRLIKHHNTHDVVGISFTP